MPTRTALVPLAAALFAFALAACGSSGETETGHHSGTGAGKGSGGSDTGAGGAGTGGGGTGGEGVAEAPQFLGITCPHDMALVGAFCMDRYEAPNQAGAEPLVMQSALDGEKWCADKGKRLCTEDEWVTACEGPKETTYPYGDTHVTSRCNDDKLWKVVNEQVLNTWPSQAAQDEVQKLYQGSPSGSYEECMSGYGVYDLPGNIEEWVVRTQPHANNYPHVLKGCYWAGCYGGSKPTCASTNPAHASAFRYYETGFRCCADLSIIAP